MRLAVTTVLTITALTCTGGPALATADTSAADKAAITKVINAAERSTDPNKSCAVFTSTLIKKMYSSKQYCLNAHATYDPASDLPKSITVSSISVSGSKAYRLCGLKGLLDRSDKTFFAFEKEIATANNKVFGKTLYACTSKAPGGKSPFRKLFEADIRQRFGTDPKGVEGADCAGRPRPAPATRSSGTTSPSAPRTPSRARRSTDPLRAVDLRESPCASPSPPR
jgi:hypothetical protein